MVPSVVVLFLFVLVLYAYKNHNREFEATTSAIQQIWSGTCRLSCRQSDNHRLSGLSVLDKDKALVDEASNCLTSQRECVCDTCPCALVENVLRTCKPATNMYNQSIELISSGYYNVVKTICDAVRMAGIGISETGPGKSNLFSIQPIGSADNINFVNQAAVKAEVETEDLESNEKKEVESFPKKVASVFRRKKSELVNEKELTFRKNSDVSISKELAAVSRKVSLNNAEKRDADSETSIRPISDQNSCSKCKEQGKVCMGNCPRANDKEKN